MPTRLVLCVVAFALLALRADAADGLRVAVAGDQSTVDVFDGDTQVLRYQFGTAPVPKGIAPRYACGDYIQPLCGPDGEALTQAQPKDHPHHRGVMWAWPVCRWADKVCDPWAVRGLWVRPEKLRRAAIEHGHAVIDASLLWKWADKHVIARQEVFLRIAPQADRTRTVDIELRLTALTDAVSIGGRPKRGYGGFGIRMAPRKAQQITLFTDPPAATPRRAWIEYSDTFAGGKGRVGVAVFQHPANPLAPSELQKYPNLNYVMPAFPGAREFPLPKGTPVVLRYRLWIHPGHADAKALAAQWAAYAQAKP